MEPLLHKSVYQSIVVNLKVGNIDCTRNAKSYYFGEGRILYGIENKKINIFYSGVWYIIVKNSLSRISLYFLFEIIIKKLNTFCTFNHRLLYP